MEHRFDELSKTLAQGLTRRTLLRRLGGGGAAGALLLSTSVKKATAQEKGGGVCLRPFEIAIRHGPSAGLTLNGVLALGVDAAGNLRSGAYALTRDKTVAKVTGQIVGRAINLIFDLGRTGLFFGTGTLQNDIRLCRGAMRGPLVGPKRGDLGDWEECCCPEFDPTCDGSTTPICTDCGGGADVDYCGPCLGACASGSGFFPGEVNCRRSCLSFC